MLIEQVEETLDHFDFEKVRKVMEVLEWSYHDSEDTVASISETRRMARRMLTLAYEAAPRPEYSTSCGGFEATRTMYPGDTTKYLTLKFVVTDWSNPCC